MGGALVAISAPVYWLGLVTLYLFSDDIGVVRIFPGSGRLPGRGNVFEKAWALTLPWLVLATAFAAIYARLLRSNLLETMSEDYIRTARAKGLPEREVMLRHGLRSAITPVITVLGLDIGILFGGAILTETVFSIDGVGRLAYDAIQRGDLATIQGTTVFLALGAGSGSLVVDVLYAFLDPRAGTDVALLEVQDLKVHFHTDDGVVKAVDGVSYSVDRGQALGIVGESGSGKSVGSLTVMGLTRVHANAEISGRILFDGKDLLAASEEDPPSAGRRDRDDLPGPAVVAASLLPNRQATRRGRPRPPRREQGPGPRSGGRDAGACRHARNPSKRRLNSVRASSSPAAAASRRPAGS